LATVSSACSRTLPRPADAGHPSDEVVEVPFPPPPARVEFVPPPPRDADTWIDGEWDWNGRRWAWTYGGWVTAPPDAIFSRWKTRRLPDGTLLYTASTWRNASGKGIDAPKLLARARAREENVITPEGETEKTAPNQSPTTAVPSK
jgi:hypothetical protein